MPKEKTKKYSTEKLVFLIKPPVSQIEHIINNITIYANL